MSGPRLAVLVSGGGTTLENFVSRIADGRLQAEVALVISSKTSAYAVERARSHGLPCAVVEWRRDVTQFSARITQYVRDAGADLVVLGGFLRLWDYPGEWDGRVLNIHPALLPAFGGRGMFGHRVHEAVLASGARVSGCTVHFASREYDQGPIIVQKTVPVLDDDTPDTLAARVFEQECEAYPEAITLFAQDRLRIEANRVRILPARS